MLIKTLNKTILVKFLDQILHLDKLQMNNFETWGKENFLKDIPLKYKFSCLALDRDKVLGFSIVSKKGRSGHLHRIVVDPSSENKGVGSKMLQFIKLKAQDNNLTSIVAETLKKPSLVRFYTKNFFRRISDQGLRLFSMNKPDKIRQLFLDTYTVFVLPLKGFTVSIHQPYFLPWLGFFDKMRQSDLFVILDDAQFEKNSFINRNQIKVNGDKKWLTIPTKGHLKDKIKDVQIDETQNWRQKHLKSLQYNYSKTANFDRLYGKIKKIYEQKNTNLCQFNLSLMCLMAEELKVQVPMELSSSLGLKSEHSQKLLDINKNFQADVYLSGVMGKTYLDQEIFKKAGIKIKFQSFKPPKYRQPGDNFIDNLSAIDYLFRANSDK